MNCDLDLMVNGVSPALNLGNSYLQAAESCINSMKIPMDFKNLHKLKQTEKRISNLTKTVKEKDKWISETVHKFITTEKINKDLIDRLMRDDWKNRDSFGDF